MKNANADMNRTWKGKKKHRFKQGIDHSYRNLERALAFGLYLNRKARLALDKLTRSKP